MSNARIVFPSGSDPSATRSVPPSGRETRVASIWNDSEAGLPFVWISAGVQVIHYSGYSRRVWGFGAGREYLSKSAPEHSVNSSCIMTVT